MDAKLARRKGMRKVGEVAALFGTTPRTLLFYEEHGILSPKKTPGGTRMYSDADVRRFEVAYKLSSLGVPLKTISDLATIRPAAASGNDSGRKLAGILDELIGDLQSQIRHLDHMKQDLERGRLMIRLCFDCPNKPSRTTCPDCPCEKLMEESELLWLTWDSDRGDDAPETSDARLADDDDEPGSDTLAKSDRADEPRAGLDPKDVTSKRRGRRKRGGLASF